MPDDDCSLAASRHNEGLSLVARAPDRVVYFSPGGHRVEMTPSAGCELMLEQRGTAVGHRIALPFYTYRVTRFQPGEPRESVFRGLG